jgi:cysteine synthase
MLPEKAQLALANGITTSVLDSIGNTPLSEMKVDYENDTWFFFAKLEFMNPTGSVKDRIAKYIVEQAEQRGELKPDSIIVEATSGNTGIGLSMIAAVKGYKLIIVMPEHMSLERRKIMSNLGAEICLTPTAESFAGARTRTEKMASRDPRVFLPRQFQNPDNTKCHYHTTGKEILEQINGRKIDAFVAGVGTGGTLMGVGKRLREANPDCKLIAVEPDEAAILSGCKNLEVHQIAGIGDGFVPELLDLKQIDWPDAIRSEDAIAMARQITRKQGMMVGVSSGANVLSTIKVLKKIGKDKTVVTVLPDRSERYFSTPLYEGKREEIIRCCRTGCENPFCEFRIAI